MSDPPDALAAGALMTIAFASLRQTLHHVADLLADILFEQQTVAKVPEQRDVCPTPAPSDYLTPDEYARRRGVGRSTVFRWLRAGLPSIKQGGARRVRWREADAFLDAGRMAKHRRKSR